MTDVESTDATTGAAATAVAPDADPIFAAITAHAEAVATIRSLDTLIRVRWGSWGETPPDEVDRLCEAVSKPEWDALENLFTTMPTTLPGVVALLRHLDESSDGVDQHSILFEAPYSPVRDALVGWPSRLAEAVAAMAGEAGR